MKRLPGRMAELSADRVEQELRQLAEPGTLPTVPLLERDPESPTVGALWAMDVNGVKVLRYFDGEKISQIGGSGGTFEDRVIFPSSAPADYIPYEGYLELANPPTITVFDSSQHVQQKSLMVRQPTQPPAPWAIPLNYAVCRVFSNVITALLLGEIALATRSDGSGLRDLVVVDTGSTWVFPASYSNVELRPTDPTNFPTGTRGRLWFNTTDLKLKIRADGVTRFVQFT